jgi:predicted acetyltransferase
VGRLRPVTDLRPFAPTELAAAHHALELAFGGDPHPEDQAVELSLVDADLTLGAFDDGVPVATAGWFDLTMALPGAVAPVAGVTWVSVAPTHRRRGILTAMMRRQLADLRTAGRPVAALWASEGAIYQRFGYGPASWHQSVEVRRGAAFTRAVDVTGLRMAPPTAELLGPVFDAVLPGRPGWYARSADWWTYRLHDPSHRREGASPLRCVVDGDEGYTLFSTKGEWGQNGPDGAVRVRELVARTPGAEARLWRFLLDQDLMARLTAWALPVDSPLLHLLSEPRAAQARVGDALWVRLVSVPEALALRRYATDVDVVLDVVDGVCPWNAGRWRLSGGPEGASCTATTDPAELRLDVRELGAAYLGGTALVTRAAAGGVAEEHPGALARASLAFGWPGRAAHCPMVF